VPQIDHRVQPATKKSGVPQELAWLVLIGGGLKLPEIALIGLSSWQLRESSVHFCALPQQHLKLFAGSTTYPSNH
jgi:hypothetical protein